jgi:hypothetical protein
VKVITGVSDVFSERHATRATATRKAIALRIATIGPVAQTGSARLISAILYCLKGSPRSDL